MAKDSKSHFVSKIISLFIGILLLTSSVVFPQKARAQLVVHDPLNYIENTLSAIGVGSTAISTNLSQVQMSLLNPIAWMLAKETLQSVVSSTINSVNRGPNGAPGFVTNLNVLMQQVGDTAANNFLAQLSSNSAISSPFQTVIASAIGNNYLRSTGAMGFFNSNPYTLNQIASNDRGFLSGNFSQGGFMALASAFSNPANNPYGAAELASEGLNSIVANAQNVQKQELNYGQGFLASRGTCNTSTTGGTTGQTASSSKSTGSIKTILTSLSGNSTCQSSPIKTPGTVIKASLDKALGSGVDTLVNAHTFDEIIGSLLSQLVNQVFTAGGLAGISQPSTRTTPGNGTSATTTTTASYFNQTDTSTSAVNAQLSASFSSTISQQITSLQEFQANWTKINNAALAANTALSACSNSPSAQSTITNTVQPVLQQAATELQQASSGITSLQGIQQQLTTASSSTDPTTALSNVSTAYTTELAVLPTASDISYAQSESIDTGANTPSSLYTQMMQIAKTGSSCAPSTT